MTSNKAKQVEADKKLTDHINSYAKLIDYLSRKSGLKLTEGLTKNLINGYSFLLDYHYFDDYHYFGNGGC